MSESSYIALNSIEEICQGIDERFTKQIYNFQTPNISQFYKFFIPPLPITIGVRLSMSIAPSSQNVLMAIRYGNPTQSYSSRLDIKEFTHPNPTYRDFKYITDLQNQDSSIYFSTGFSTTFDILRFTTPESVTDSAGSYLYLNLFGGRSRIQFINFQLELDVKNTKEWCKNPTQPGPQPPTGKTCQRMISLPPGTHTIQVSGETKTFTVQQNQITDISINNKIIQLNSKIPIPDPFIIPNDEYIVLNTFNDICNNLNTGTSNQTFNEQVSSPYEKSEFKHKLFIPPVPITSRMNLNFSFSEGSGRILIAMKYGSPPKNYNTNIDDNSFTHSNAFAESFKRLTDLKEEVVTYYSTGFSKNYNILSFGTPQSITNEAGGWLYINLFGGERQRILNIRLNLRIDTEEALKWCKGGFNVE